MSLSNIRPLGRGLALVSTALVATANLAFAAVQFESVHSFNGTDGFGPMAGVDMGPDGALYGTTSQGGGAGLGTVFRLDRASRVVTTLHAFAGPDGDTVYSGLVRANDGFWYGTTYAGGNAGLGTLFRLGADGSGFVQLHSFGDVSGEGIRPDDLHLSVAADGSLLGATSEGGTSGGGTLFRWSAASAVLTTVHEFSSPSGSGVDAGLVAGRDGYWYGTTYSGGATGYGSIFRLDRATLSPTTLHDFIGTDGASPVPGALMQGADGLLYGTTQGGGYGTVYQLDPSTLTLRTLHRFSGVNDGRFPLGGVTEGGDGYLYGTTALGGAGYGIVFRVDPVTGAYGIVVWFGGSNGRMPTGNLVRTSGGSLYGTTRVGGAFNAGTVYRVAGADTQAPTIVSLSATPNLLRPANGRMVPVTVAVSAADDWDPAPRSRIVGVTCNEPAAAGDWRITGDLSMELRAKRLGRTARVYTIAVECTDVSGNTVRGTAEVTVPK